MVRLLLVAVMLVSMSEAFGQSVLDLKAKDIKGEEVDLSKYKGKVVLIVNTASRCGYTPQYEGLENLHRKYKDKGLAVIAFPSNDFGKQEPGNEAQIEEFCKTNYNVSFDLFSKVAVKSQPKSNIYEFLTSTKTNPNHAGDVRWNFEKFLVNRKGEVVARYQSSVDPESDTLENAIKAELSKE